MKILNIILNYLNQPSTYKGLFSVLAAFGVILKPEMADAIIACALGVIGLINVCVNEHKSEPENENGEKA